MRVNVRNEGPKNAGLCTNCSSFWAVSYENGGQGSFCTSSGDGPQRLRGIVEKCNRFNDKDEMSLWDMKQIATILEVEGGRFIGFVKPGDERYKEIMHGLQNE